MFTGVLVNFASILAGSAAGLLLRSKLNQKYHTALMDAIGLGVAGIGIAYVIKTGNIPVLIISLILGTLLGTLLRIDDGLEKLGDKIKTRFNSKEDTFAEGFASTSILFCVGSMAIVGCLDSAMKQDNTLLFTKSIMDGVSSIFFASAMGIGVLFSAFSVLIYQGLLTLLFSLFAGGLDMSVISEISAVGGVILIGISINMLKLKKIKTADMIISLFLPILLIPLMKHMGS